MDSWYINIVHYEKKYGRKMGVKGRKMGIKCV